MVQWAQRLREVMPADGLPTPRRRNWAAVDESWGFEFPDDYKWFGGVYGSGTVNGFMGVLMPEIWAEDPSASEMVNETLSIRYQVSVSGDRGVPFVAPRAESLVAWGGSDWGDTFCWVSSPEGSSDDWKVIAFFRDEMRWQRFDCGMVEFLARAIMNDLPGWVDPMGYKRRMPAVFEAF